MILRPLVTTLLQPPAAYWQGGPADTNEYCLSVMDPNRWWKAVVKFDGCVHFNHAHNAAFKPDGSDNTENGGDSDYSHICDLDDYIERLLALRDLALKHFGPDWPD